MFKRQGGVHVVTDHDLPPVRQEPPAPPADAVAIAIDQPDEPAEAATTDAADPAGDPEPQPARRRGRAQE
jgi:hypothetical protein